MGKQSGARHAIAALHGARRPHGKAVTITATFFCNPTRDKESSGALGFDLQISNVKALAPFKFDDFEGPDARVRSKLMRISVTRAREPDLVVTAVPNGSYSDVDTFTFGFAEVSHLAQSEPKAILLALAKGAQSFKAVITEPRNAALKLEIEAPVAGRQSDFQALLMGVK